MRTFKDLTQQSILFLNQGRFEDAEKILNQIILKFPADPDAYINKVFLLISQNNFIEAKISASKTLKKFPNNSLLYNAIGISNLKLNHLSESEENFKRSIKLDHNNYHAYINLSNLYMQEKNFIEALRTINQGLIINFNYLNFHEIRVKILKNLGLDKEKKEQEKILKRIQEINNLFHKEYIGRRKKLDELNKIIIADSRNLKALLERAELFFKLKLFDSALNDAELLINFENKNINFLKLKTRILIAQGKFDEAIKFSNIALKVKEEEDLYLYQAKVYQVQDEEKKFLKVLNQLNGRYLDDENKFEFSKYLLGQEKYDKAWEFFKARVNLDAYSKYRKKTFQSSSSVKKVAIMSELGLGDQLLFLTALLDFIEFDKQYDIFLDERLTSLFNHFPLKYELQNVNFKFDEDYNESNYDQVMFIGDIFVKSLSKNPYLKKNFFPAIDIENNQNIKNRIGIAWKSKNKKINKDISIYKLLSSFKGKANTFVNLQYGDIGDLIESAKKLKISIETNKNVDNYFDLALLLELINSCNVIITSSNLTVHLASLIGKKVLLLIPKRLQALWYWQPEGTVSKWYPNVKIIELNENYNQIQEELDRLV